MGHILDDIVAEVVVHNLEEDILELEVDSYLVGILVAEDIAKLVQVDLVVVVAAYLTLMEPENLEEVAVAVAAVVAAVVVVVAAEQVVVE